MSNELDESKLDESKKIPEEALGMNLAFDEDYQMFIITYFKQDQALFQVKMTPEGFEKFTADMVRVVKNYNLHQAQQYQERMKKTDERRSKVIGMVDGKEEVGGVEGSPVQPEENVEKGCCGPSEVL